jgi:3-hydroxyacyl-CoA dehydrogenase
MHFSNPVTTMRMCEVIYTPETSQETIETTKGLAEAAGKVVSMVKDTPGTYGFILNRASAPPTARQSHRRRRHRHPEDVDKARSAAATGPPASSAPAAASAASGDLSPRRARASTSSSPALAR